MIPFRVTNHAPPYMVVYFYTLILNYFLFVFSTEFYSPTSIAGFIFSCIVFIFQVAKALIELFGEMVFVHGFVHGDPHPGNILVSPQGNGKFSLGTHYLNMVFSTYPYSHCKHE
jgi:hypothetical protein